MEGARPAKVDSVRGGETLSVNRSRHRAAIRTRNTSFESHCTQLAAPAACLGTSVRETTRCTSSIARWWPSNSARSRAGTVRRRTSPDSDRFRGDCRQRRMGSSGRSHPASDWSSRRTPASRWGIARQASSMDLREGSMTIRRPDLYCTRSGPRGRSQRREEMK